MYLTTDVRRISALERSLEPAEMIVKLEVMPSTGGRAMLRLEVVLELSHVVVVWSLGDP
jgi:hypothetical protein